MGLLQRLRGRASRAAPERLKPALRTVAGGRRATPTFVGREAELRTRLHDDPNDAPAFRSLVDIVRRRVAEGHEVPEADDAQRAADDAVWALAEDFAGNHRAWYPLVELARLSIHDDRDGALRRLATAAERDPSGRALGEGVLVLRDAGLPADALGLGVGHWRPAEHDVEAGRQLVHAAVEARRFSEAQRHLEALSQHPDRGRVAPVQRELERLIAEQRPARP
jgi:hypothetical protein